MQAECKLNLSGWVGGWVGRRVGGSRVILGPISVQLELELELQLGLSSAIIMVTG